MSDSASTQPPSDYDQDPPSPIHHNATNSDSRGENHSVLSKNALASPASAPLSNAPLQSTQAHTMGNSHDPAIAYLQNTFQSINELPPLMNYASQPMPIPLLEPLIPLILPSAALPGHIQARPSVSLRGEPGATPLECIQVLPTSHSQALISVPPDHTQGLPFESRFPQPIPGQVKELQRLRRLQRTAIRKEARERKKTRARGSQHTKSAPPKRSLRKRVHREAPNISDGNKQNRPRKRKVKEVENGEGAPKQKPRRKRNDSTPRTKSSESELEVPSSSPIGYKGASKDTSTVAQTCSRKRSIHQDARDELAPKDKLQLKPGVQKRKPRNTSIVLEQKDATTPLMRKGANKTFMQKGKPALPKQDVRNATDLCESPSSKPAKEEIAAEQLRQKPSKEMPTKVDEVALCQPPSSKRILEVPSGGAKVSPRKSPRAVSTKGDTKKALRDQMRSRDKNQKQAGIDEVAPNLPSSVVRARETDCVSKVSRHMTMQVLPTTKPVVAKKCDPKLQIQRPTKQEGATKDANASKQKTHAHEITQEFSEDIVTPAPTQNPVRKTGNLSIVKNLEKKRITELENQVMQLRWELLNVATPNEKPAELKPIETNMAERVKCSPSEAIAIARITECWSRIETAYPPWEIRSKISTGAYTRGQLSLHRLYDHVMESIKKGIAPPCHSTFRALQHSIISTLQAANKADFTHTPQHATIIFTMSKMTQTFLNSVFSLFLQAPSSADMCWSMAVVEYIVVPLLQYSKSESDIVYGDVGKSCVKAVCDAAVALSPEEGRPRQVQVELSVRAIEMCIAILNTEDYHILSQIPESTVCAIGSRNILFSLRYAALKSK